MANESRRVSVLIETAHRLLRRGALAHVQRLLSKAHEADVAILFRHVAPAERVTVFGALASRERKAAVLSELDDSIQATLLQEIGTAEAVAVLEEMDRDDIADLLRRLPEEFSTELLGRMRREESIQVEGLLGYEEDTAGGMMSPEFFALRDEATVQEAIDACRAGDEFEMVFYVYVVNEFGHLVGVISLRQLVTAGEKSSLKDIMETDVVRVRAHTDASEVAKLVARYNFLALPVVDDANKLIGIVTVDDVIDVIRDEATEDVLRVVGAGEDLLESHHFWANMRARLPWILVAVVGGLLTVPIIAAFADAGGSQIGAWLFLPLMLSLGGNVGIQTSTLLHRQLSSGSDPHVVGFRVLAREVAVGGAFGLIAGVLAFGVALLYGVGLGSAAVLGGSLPVGTLLAALTGAAVPFAIRRFWPGSSSFATGPFVKALCDAVVLVVYLLLSTTVLAWIQA